MAKKSITVCPKNPVLIIDDTGGLMAEQDPNGKLTPIGSFSLEDLANSLQRDKPITTGLIPRGIKGFSKKINSANETIYSIVVEQLPTIITIRYKAYNYNLDQDDVENNDDYYEDIYFDLQLPYIYGIFSIKDNAAKTVIDSKLFCSPTEITLTSDQLYGFPISNVYYDGRICWGNDFPELKTINIYEYAIKILNEFWKLPFNRDLFPEYPSATINEVKLSAEENKVLERFGYPCDLYDLSYYMKWAKLTKENPMFYQTMKLQPLYRLSSLGVI